MAYTVGSAFLQIVPSFSGIVEKIESQFSELGDIAGDAFDRAFGARTEDVQLGPGDTETEEQGESAGGKFADGFRARVDAALKALPDATVHLDDTDADVKLDDLRSRLETLRGATIGVDLSDVEALSAIEILKAELDELGARSPDIRVRVDALGASTELAAIGAEADTAELQTDGFFASIVAGAGEADFAMSPLVLVIGAIALAAIPLVALFGGALAVLPAVLGGFGVGALAVVAAFKTLSGLLTQIKFDFAEWSNEVQPLVAPIAAAIKTLVQAGFQVLTPLIGPAAQGITSFLQGLAGMISQGPGLQELTNIFTAGVQFLTKMGTAALKAFGGLLKAATQATPLLRTIGALISHLATSFAHWVASGGFQKFVEWLQKNGPGIVKDVGDLIKGVGSLAVALAPVGLVLLKVAGFLGQLVGWVAKTPALLAALTIGLGAAYVAFDLFVSAGPIGLLVAAIALLVIGIIELVAHWTAVWSEIKELAFDAWHFLWTNVLAPIDTFFTATVPAFLSAAAGFFESAWSAISGAFNTAWQWIDNNVVHPVVHFFTTDVPNALDTAVGFFTGLPGRIGSALSSVWSTITGAFGDIATWVTQHIIGPVVDLFKTIPHDIATALGDAAGIAKSVVDAIIGGINSAIDWVNNHIPSVLGVKLFPSLPHIPELATGGPVIGGQPYIVGEVGPELFVPQTSGTIIPNHELTATGVPVGGGAAVARLTDADRALLRAVAARPVQVDLDSRVLATSVNRIRRGKSLQGAPGW